jgi:protein ImuB
LLEERLNHWPLTAPVREIELRADDPEPLRPRPSPRSLFPELEPVEEGRGAEALTALLDLLRARLGDGAVQALSNLRDPRPESVLPAGAKAPPLKGAGPRPLWLLDPPEPLRHHRGLPYRGGRLTLEGERERIETGWWDGRPIARDYFIAHAGDGQRLWVYRDLREQGGWYLHGLFG